MFEGDREFVSKLRLRFLLKGGLSRRGGLRPSYTQPGDVRSQRSRGPWGGKGGPSAGPADCRVEALSWRVG